MRKKLLMLFALLTIAGTSYAHDLEPLHVDGRYLKNPKGDIVTLHGWLTGWCDLYPEFYEEDKDHEAHFKAWKMTTDSILACGYKLDYARLHFWYYDSRDFDGFVQRGDFEKLFLPMADYLNNKGIYVLLMADVAGEGDGDLRTIGDSWQQRLLKYWNYVSSHPRIKDNPGVMFELSNEPGNFKDSDGSLNNFKTMRNYYQPMVDLIRKNGCQQVIYVPGWGCQINYSGYAVYPVEGENIGYAVHSYSWLDDDGDYDFLKLRWKQQIKLASNMAPIIVTESGWDNGFGGWGTSTSTFGRAFKRISEEYGNVSWNLISGGIEMCRVNQPSPDGELAVYNDPEACYVPYLEWTQEYANTKITPVSQLKAEKVELEDVFATVYPGDTRPITLMATFADGRRWNVAGDAVWTSSDESVITVKQGNMHVKKEGTVTIHGKYTDGTGKVFDVEFSVLSSLFPLTAEGVQSEFWFGAKYDSDTHTFSGDGSSGWFYLADMNFIGKIAWRNSWNYSGGINLSAYKYLVIRLNDYPTGGAELWLNDLLDEEPEVKVNLQGNTEIVVDLHAYPELDLNHIVSVCIWQCCDGKLSVKEIFLSNDGVNPVTEPYTINTVVTACDVTMSYGDDVPELTYTVVGDGNVGMPKLTTTATKASPVGIYDIIVTEGGTADGNVLYKPGKLTIVPTTLTVTANDVLVGMGKDIPELTLSYDGLRNGETAAEILLEQPIVTTTATNDSPCGNYEITVSGGKATNYELVWHKGTLTIIPDATISLPADRTTKVATSPEAWNAGGECGTEYAPAVTTADGRTAPMVEHYEETVATTGIMMEQIVTGLEPGEYTVVLCANAYYTDGRGFYSGIKEEATDVVELYANDVHQAMTAHIGGATSQNDVYTLTNVKVIDGTMCIGMEKLKAGTNWHTLQIKSLTLTKQYSLSESFTLALAKAEELLPQKMYVGSRSKLLDAMVAEQTYPNYYRLALSVHEALNSVKAMKHAAKALEFRWNEMLLFTNVCTTKAYNEFLIECKDWQEAYDYDIISAERAWDYWNPHDNQGGGGGVEGFWGFVRSAWDVAGENPLDLSWYWDWGPASDFDLPFMEYATDDDKKLDARTLTAIMTDMEPGQYTVTAWIRLRRMNDSNEAPKGITLQVCNGSPVAIGGQQMGDTNYFIDHYTATGIVGSDGVLTIKFNVAADNNVSRLAFKDLWQERGDLSTITANDITITYGDEIPELGYTAQGDAFEGEPMLSTTATKASPVGTYPITVEKGTVTRHAVNYVTGTLTITKAPLTVKAGTYTKKQGEENPAFTLTYEGWKNNETETVLTIKPTAITTATKESAPGEYEVKVSGGEAKNYELSYTNGKLIVTDADAVVITAKSYTRVYGDANPTLEYTTEGAALVGVPEITCEVTATSPVGTYPIVIKKGSVTNYNDTYVNGTLTITKAPLTIKVGSYSRKQGEENPVFAIEYEGFKNGETAEVLTKQPVVTTEAVSSSAPGKYAITVSGAEAANYEISYVMGELTVTEADPITLMAKSYTREYGEENPAFEFTTEGAALDGEPALECNATATSAVGTYDIKISKGSVANYNDTYINGTLTITKAPLTVKAVDAEREQGQDNPIFALKYNGWKNGETEKVLTKKPVAKTTATKNSPAGEYVITVSGGEAQNYELSYVNGKLTITVPSGIEEIIDTGTFDIYDVKGRKVRSQVTTLKGLKKGVYIVSGKKVVIK